MKKTKSPNEKGQIIVLLAVGMVGLLAFVALAIDGGMIFFDRRSAQNAADSAALAGAYKLARDPDNDDLVSAIQTAAYNRADDNDYTSLGKTITVDYPWAGAATRPVDGDTDTANYVRVEITSTVNTSFVHLLGVGTVKNTVEAVAHVTQSKRGNPFPGSAMVALAPHGCANANGTGGGIYFGGSGWTNLVGGGLFVNSDANCSIAGPGGSYFVYTPNLVDVGNVDGSVNNLLVKPGPDSRGATDRALSYPPKNSLTPPSSSDCSATATLTHANNTQPSSDGTTWTYQYTLTKGYYNQVLPNGDVWLEPGIHCFDNPNNKSIISLNNTQHLGGENVLIYIKGYKPCDFKWNGTNTVKLKGITDVNSNYHGLLIFVDPRGYALINEQAMQFNGKADSYINGTVYGPTCTAVLAGTDGNMYQGQMVAYNIVITGTNTFNMNYNPGDNVEINGAAKVDLAR